MKNTVFSVVDGIVHLNGTPIRGVTSYRLDRSMANQKTAMLRMCIIVSPELAINDADKDTEEADV